MLILFFGVVGSPRVTTARGRCPTQRNTGECFLPSGRVQASLACLRIYFTICFLRMGRQIHGDVKWSVVLTFLPFCSQNVFASAQLASIKA